MSKRKYSELSPEAKEARRKYHKEWAAKNPEKVRETVRRYWERKAQAEKERALVGKGD